MATILNIDRLLHNSVPGLSDTWWTHFEMRVDGQIVVKYGNKIINFDLRGAPMGHKIDYQPPSDSHGLSYQKTGPGAYHLQLSGMQPSSAPSAVDTTETVTTFPHYPIWPTGETEAPQTITETHAESVASDLAALKAAAKLVHATLESFMERLAERERLHHSSQIAVVRDHIAFGHHAVHDVLTRQSGGNGLIALTIQQRIDYCQATMLGPADITDVTDLTPEGRARTAAEIFNNLPHTGNILNASPTTARAWVDPRTGKRVKIADIENLSVGTASFTPDGETAAITGLGLNAIGTQSINPESPFSFLDPRGLWINNITA